jgi:hypothetical protein
MVTSTSEECAASIFNDREDQISKFAGYMTPAMKPSFVLGEEENQLDATQFFIELVIGSACFRHHYDHLHEL